MKQTSIAVNKLFILASCQENIMIQMEEDLTHEVKYRFNRIFTDVKKLNKLVNKHLHNDEMDGFDLITEKIDDFFKSLEE
jgi:predicted ABC-type exoprotein transport system permease subunit